MNIEIVTKETSLTPTIKIAANEAVKKAFKIQEKISNVKITIEKTNSKESEYKVYGIVYLPQKEIVVTKNGNDVYKLLHDLSEDLARQVRKKKEKKNHNKHESIKTLQVEEE